MEHMHRTGPLYAKEEAKMVNVGIDLHKTQFTTCARIGGGEVFNVYPTTKEGYRAFLETVARWQGSGDAVRAAVESLGNTRYFKNRLEEGGIGVTVVNPLKMKVISESVKKTDKYDAATIAEFLEKDMLPQSQLCSRESEKLRRLLRVRQELVRGEVSIKNQIHAMLTAEGMEDPKGTLQSKRGRKQVLDALNQCANELEAQTLFDILQRQEESVKAVEKQLRLVTKGNKTAELLMTIPGCGEICAWTILAYTDDIKRFASSKKYVSFAGLAPWVQNSNEKVRHGSITKRGPKELRTALVQVVMGMRRMKAKTATWRMMQRYEALKKNKCSGNAIIATARKVAVIIWHMLSGDNVFDAGRASDAKTARNAESTNRAEPPAKDGLARKPGKSASSRVETKGAKKTGVAREKKKVG
jgi:transposase